MDETKKYYYVAFTTACCGGIGSYSIAQLDGIGFNLGGAHRFLLEKFKHVCVITWFTEIPKHQHEGLHRFNNWCIQKFTDATGHEAQALSVIKGGCDKPTPPKGELKPVPNSTDDK